MTFENISENAVLNAGGRLLDPGAKIPLDVEYYARYKDFIDAYVDRKVGKLSGLEEYEEFIRNGGKKEESKEEKVNLMEEVRAEEEIAKAEGVAKEEPANEEQKEPEATKKKPTSRRRKPAQKKTSNEEE